MHVEVVLIQKQIPFTVSFIYGLNSHLERVPLWNSIRHLASSIVSPWILLGDFNVVRYPSERLGGSCDWPARMEDLNDCCVEAGLEDLKFTGNLLTWRRGSGQTFLSKKLDRALVNLEWMHSFPESEAAFLQSGYSDHSPIVINTGIQLHQRRTSFKYFE